MKILIAALLLASITASAEPTYPEGWICSADWLSTHPDGGDIVCTNAAAPRG